MLKIFKNKKDITFDEKEDLIFSYYQKSKYICDDYYSQRGCFANIRDKNQKLDILLTKLKDIQLRIKELKEYEVIENDCSRNV